MLHSSVLKSRIIRPSLVSHGRMNRLAFVGGIVLSVVSVALFFGITTVACSSQGIGTCIVTHPIWALAMLPFGLALVGLSFVHRVHSSTEMEIKV